MNTRTWPLRKVIAVGVQRSLQLSTSALVVAAFLFVGVMPSPAVGGSRAVRAAAQAAGTVPRVQIPDTAYSIPSGALFVAPTGNDANAGTMAAPFLSVAHAVSVAPSGATIVLRAGIYRETFGTVVRPVTIEPYPHEQAWLSGSDVVTGWATAGSGWVHHGWTAQFCHTCYAAGAVDPLYPLAGWPDQMFFDGAPLTQVADLAHLASGTFFVDYTAHDLYVGSDPTVSSLTVEATTRVYAGQFQPAAAGSIVRGVGFMQYGPNWNENLTGEIEDLAANMRFDKDVFTQSAARGLHVASASHVTVVDSLIVNNGFTGLYTRNTDYFDMERNVLDNNNTEKFWDGFSSAAGAAGVKISSSYHVMAKGNIATNNWGNGMWSDVSSYDVSFVDNFAAHNSRNGLYVEITGTSVVASNLSILNGQGGLKLSGATSARVYNNTFADNATYQLSVHDDGRNQPDPTKAALGITWNTAKNTFVNNILAAPTAGSVGPLIFTENNDKPVIVDAATMIVGMDYDLFTRPTAALPALFAWWIHPAPAATTQYATMATFKAGTGYEAHGNEVNGYTTSPIFVAPNLGNYTPVPGGPANKTGASLPADIAALVGAPAGVAVDRGALIYPGAVTPPPPPPTIYATDTFSRVVNGGWGKATTGGTWGLTPATAPWAVNGSAGTVTAVKGQNVIAGIVPRTTTDAELSITFSSTALSSAQPKFAFIVRNVNSSHQYQARVRVTAAGAILVAMTRLSGTTYTLVGPEMTLPGITYAPGKALRIRADADGIAPTALRVRVWLASAVEPVAWNIVTTDNDPTLQAPGSFGVLAIPQAGVTGSKAAFTFDDLVITSA